MRKGILLCALLGAILFDGAFNASRTVSFAAGEGAQYWLMYGALIAGAFVLAACPAVIGYEGSKQAAYHASLAACMSALLSVSAVINSADMRADLSQQHIEQRQYLQNALLGHESKIMACRNDRYCDSQAMRDKYDNLQMQKSALPAAQTIDSNSAKEKTTTFFLAMFCVLFPFISGELSRQLGRLELKKGTLGGSNGSQPRNLDEKKPEPKPASKRKPNKKQIEQLEISYKAMKNRGVKITQTALALEAGISKQAAGYWLNNFNPNVIALNKKPR